LLQFSLQNLHFFILKMQLTHVEKGKIFIHLILDMRSKSYVHEVRKIRKGAISLNTFGKFFRGQKENEQVRLESFKSRWKTEQKHC
jgi:hypothetical protein